MLKKFFLMGTLGTSLLFAEGGDISGNGGDTIVELFTEGRSLGVEFINEVTAEELIVRDSDIAPSLKEKGVSTGKVIAWYKKYQSRLLDEIRNSKIDLTNFDKIVDRAHRNHCAYTKPRRLSLVYISLKNCRFKISDAFDAAWIWVNEAVHHTKMEKGIIDRSGWSVSLEDKFSALIAVSVKRSWRSIAANYKGKSSLKEKFFRNIRLGNVEVIEAMLKGRGRNKVDPNWVNDSTRSQTPLMFSLIYISKDAIEDYVDIANALLDAGAYVKVRDAKKKTAIDFAVTKNFYGKLARRQYAGYVALMKRLLGKSKRQSTYDKIIVWAAGHLESSLVDILKDKASKDSVYSALISSLQSVMAYPAPFKDLFDLMIHRLSKVQQKRILSEAADRHDLKTVKYFVDKGFSSASADKWSRNAMHTTLFKKHYQGKLAKPILKYLFEKGDGKKFVNQRPYVMVFPEDGKRRSWYNLSPLGAYLSSLAWHDYENSEWTGVGNYLLANGADPNLRIGYELDPPLVFLLKQPNAKGNTGHAYAISYQLPSIIKMTDVLLSNKKTNVNAKTKLKQTALDFAFAYYHIFADSCRRFEHQRYYKKFYQRKLAKLTILYRKIKERGGKHSACVYYNQDFCNDGAELKLGRFNVDPDRYNESRYGRLKKVCPPSS